MIKVSFHTFLAWLSSSLLFSSSSLPFPLLLSFSHPFLSSPPLETKLGLLLSIFVKAMFGQVKNSFLAFKFLYLPFSPPLLLFLQLILCYFHFGLKSCQIMTFKLLFGQITILSLNLVNFRVPRFHVSHLTHETFKLHLQNTLNMSETVRVYFGVLQKVLVASQRNS